MQRYSQLILLCVQAKKEHKFLDPQKLAILSEVKANIDNSENAELKEDVNYKRLEFIFGNNIDI